MEAGVEATSCDTAVPPELAAKVNDEAVAVAVAPIAKLKAIDLAQKRGLDVHSILPESSVNKPGQFLEHDFCPEKLEDQAIGYELMLRELDHNTCAKQIK
eukprot:6707266-Alexandrium_andersonii.AAC.1